MHGKKEKRKVPFVNWPQIGTKPYQTPELLSTESRCAFSTRSCGGWIGWQLDGCFMDVLKKCNFWLLKYLKMRVFHQVHPPKTSNNPGRSSPKNPGGSSPKNPGESSPKKPGKSIPTPGRSWTPGAWCVAARKASHAENLARKPRERSKADMGDSWEMGDTPGW